MDGFFYLSPIFEGMLLDTQASHVTELFLWLVACVFVLAALLSRAGRGQGFVRDTPTLLTSIGILGTFVGIVVGLMHFDPQDIDASIPALLAGLKTAFITSLAGMGGAIAFKILSTGGLLAPRSANSMETSNAGPEEILNALLKQGSSLDALRKAIAGDEETSLIGQMKLMRADQTDQGRQTLRAVGELKNAISGSEDDSLVGQVKLLRADEQDRHRTVMTAVEEDRAQRERLAEKLWQELGEFAEMLSKSASEQVINALKEVIVDFNRNLTEQFGENFKALDASVQKLVQWQENYRVQLEQMSEQYAQGVLAITQTETSVAHISEESRQIPVTMGLLKIVMEVNQHQIGELNTHLDAFREMRDRAVEAVPEIRRQVEETVQDVAASVKAANEHYTTLLDSSDAYLKAHEAQSETLLERFVQTTDDGIGKVRDGLEAGANGVKDAIAASTAKFSVDVQDLLNGTTTTITGSVQAANDHYATLLDRSDTYLKAHDAQSQALLERFVQTTDDGIGKVRDGLEAGANATKLAILSGAEEFNDSVQRLNANLTSTSDQIATQSENIRLQLKDTFEEVNAHVRVITSTLSTESQQLAETLKNTGTQIQRDTQATQQQVAESINQMQSRLESALQEVFLAQAKAMNGTVDALEEQMRKAIAKTGEGVNAQLSAIDSAMQQEVQRVMNEMGSALGQIAGRFTQDYITLVGAMQNIVQQAQNRPAG